MINIAYSGLNLCRPLTGVGRYLQSISRVQDLSIKKTAFVPNHNIQIDHGFDKLVFSNANSLYGKLLWSYSHILLSDFNYEIYHSPQMFLPLFKNGKTVKVITVHDLIFLDMPSLYSRIERMILKTSLFDSITRADYFICVSKYTFDSFRKHFPSKKNVRLIYNNLEFKNDLEPVNKNPQNYFILVSNRVPRKNIKNSVIGFKKSLFYKNGYELHICGASDGFIDIEWDNQIKDMGYLSEIELKKLYQNSCGLLFFSLAEGFGFPILEAASYGIPVLAAANTSILELFSNKKHLLCSDYTSSDGIATFLNKYYNSEELKVQILTVLQESLKNYSSEIFSDQLISFYKSIL